MAQSPADPDRRPPRFPYVAALLCAACLGAAGWTWMRYSYAWDLDYGQLVNATWVEGERDWPTGCFVAARGIPITRATRFAAEDYGFTRDAAEFLRLNMGEVFDAVVLPREAQGRDGIAEPTVIRGPLYGRVLMCKERLAVLDTTASRLHGASIAGLVVGAMGVFVFTVALRHWLKERRDSPMSVRSGLWLRTDETNEAVRALEMVSEQLPRVAEDPYHWKWVVIALHNALTNYMVLALQGTDALNVMPEGFAAKVLDGRKAVADAYAAPRLDSFLPLFEKVQSDRMLMYGCSEKLAANQSMRESMETLHDTRCRFEHFFPSGLSLGVGGLPQVVEDCLDGIEFLAFKSGNIPWHEEDETYRKTKELSGQVRQLTTAVRSGYGV